MRLFKRDLLSPRKLSTWIIWLSAWTLLLLMVNWSLDESFYEKYIFDPRSKRISSSAPVQLKVCSMIKNVGPRLPEWIAFHRLQGVSRFVLYDDGSTDSLTEVLKPFTDMGVVEVRSLHQMLLFLNETILAYADQPFLASGLQRLHECKNDDRNHQFSQDKCQFAVFFDCFARSKVMNDSWVGAFDVDEFIFRPLVNGKSNGTLATYLDLLPEGISQLVLKPIIFGPSEYVNADWQKEGLLITTHIQRTAVDSNGVEIIPEITKECGECLSHLAHPGSGGKAFVRVKHAIPEAAYIHQHHISSGETLSVWAYLPQETIRFFHYMFFSIEEAVNATVYNKHEGPRLIISDPRARLFYAAVNDTSAAEFGDRVAECMKRTIWNMFDKHCILFNS